VVKDESGLITEVHCSYDPETQGGDAPDGRKPKATLHWVSAAHARRVEARIFDRLFLKINPDKIKVIYQGCGSEFKQNYSWPSGNYFKR
jgi:glutaminyl-tRNA synthetase